MMEKEHLFRHHHHRERLGLGIPDDGPAIHSSRSSLYREQSQSRATTSSSPDFVLQWGNRKRLRCMKIKTRDDSSSSPVLRTTARVDRKVVREKDQTNPGSNPTTTSGGNYFNLRQRQASPPPQRILRNSEIMRVQANGGAGGDNHNKAVNHHHQDKKHRDSHNNHNHQNNHNNNSSNVEHGVAGGGVSDHDSKKGGGGSSSGSDAVPAVWPPKFVIALTNKEKEEDFMAIKGSKLPQRPKKRNKQIQRTLNLVSPGAWLCDLTLERYEVREKKTSKKRPRGLKAMGNTDSDSE